jgi:hypothetical protein
MVPAGLAEGTAIDALRAIGGAVAAAQPLPCAAGDALLMAGAWRVIDALQLSAPVDAAIVAFACVLSAR